MSANLNKLAKETLLMFLILTTCASPNKIAEERSESDSGLDFDTNRDSDSDAYRTDTNRDSDSDAYRATDTDSVSDGDPDSDMVCRAGGGDQSCAAVLMCESDCGNDQDCLLGCRDSLCTAEEELYCAMKACVATLCGALCDDLTSVECLLTCTSIYCTTTFTDCLAAAICQADL